MEVKFYQETKEKLKYVVIVARYKNQFVFCRHKERTTYELPGGHIEDDENIYEAAKRELIEETGTTKFSLEFVSYYSYNDFGALFYAEIEELGKLNFEIEEIIFGDYLPINLTYPSIQPRLFNYVTQNVSIKYESNYKRMIAGSLYKTSNYEKELHKKAVLKTMEYNKTSPYEIEKRQEIIKNLFGSTKGYFYLEPSIKVDYGCNIHIGENFYANFDSVFLDVAPIVFGDNVYVAPRCCFYTAGHPIDSTIRNMDFEYGISIRVGSNVWIGGSVVVNPGVTIGSNVVIGSGSVITKDIPSNVVAAGNPCKVIREITNEDKLKWQRLKEIAELKN